MLRNWRCCRGLSAPGTTRMLMEGFQLWKKGVFSSAFATVSKYQATMKKIIQPLKKRKAWNALSKHFKTIRGAHLRDLFAKDPKRGERLTAEAAGLYLDYSKNRITDETLNLLLQLAEEAGLRARTDAMFSGEKINASEKRAVLHIALRTPKGQSILVDGEDV